MKLNDEHDDGLWMFADVMCGTLGIVMLMAMFFVLQAAGSSGGLQLPKNPSLKSALWVDRELAARDRLRESTQTLDALRLRLGPDAKIGSTPVVMDETKRRLIELDLLNQAAIRLAQTYRAQIQRGREELIRKATLPMRIPVECSTTI
jgi:hypothetical protein